MPTVNSELSASLPYKKTGRWSCSSYIEKCDKCTLCISIHRTIIVEDFNSGEILMYRRNGIIAEQGCKMTKSKTIQRLISIAALLSMAFTNFVSSTLPKAQSINLNPASHQLIVSGSQSKSKNAFAPGIILIGLKPGTSLEATLGGASVFSTNSKVLGASLNSLHIQTLGHLFSKNLTDPLKAKSKGKVDLSGIYRVYISSNADVMSEAAQLAQNPDVAFAEPDYIAYSSNTPLSAYAHAEAASFPIPPNDPNYGDEWGMAKINIEGAWAQTEGAPTTTIAIIDSGLDTTQVDLSSNSG
jgi:hypothetical protein